MTHKSIDALLASTMFLLFTMVTPHYEDIAKKIGFIDVANAQTTTAIIPTSASTPTTVSVNKDSCTPNTYPWIKITAPTSGDTFAPGEKVNIKWQSCNTKDNRRYINLGVRQINFGDGTGYNFGRENLDNSGTGSFDYLLPEAAEFIGDGAYPYGKNYKIMVASDQNDNAYDTTAGFSIEAPYSPSVTVITPNGGEILVKGQTYRIKWETKDTNGLFVYLIKDGTFYDGNSLNSTPNTSGYIDWTVPTTIPDGSNYKIEIGEGKGDPEQATDKSDASFTITSPAVKACTNWKVTAGGPQGGTYWEKLRDFSKHPDIDQYRIQWWNGNWSPWYTPTVGDMDTKFNNDGSWRYLISYLQDHNWETRDCTDGQTNASITVANPNNRITYAPGQQMDIMWNYSGINSSKTANISMLNQVTGESVFITNTAVVGTKSHPHTIPSTVPAGEYRLKIGVLSDDLKWDLALDTSDESFVIVAPVDDKSCTSTSTPSIKVLSPNGNEAFDLNQVVSVKWTTCNIPASTMMVIHLVDTRNGSGGSFYGFTNDGQESVVPNKGGLQPLPLGSFYKIRVSAPSINASPFTNGNFPEAFSDNTFTVKDLSTKALEKNTKNQGVTSADQTGSTVSDQEITFTRRLSVGKRGDDVVLLQEILIDQGFLKASNPTGYYGPLTSRSVQKLQSANKIQATGVVGPATRALLNSIVEKMNEGGND